MESPRWKIITPSQYERERRGLDFVRIGQPDHDTYRVSANFDFQTDDGNIYEVDLLVLTKQGFWLVECKAWGGRIWGDTGTWPRSRMARLGRKTVPNFLVMLRTNAPPWQRLLSTPHCNPGKALSCSTTSSEMMLGDGVLPCSGTCRSDPALIDRLVINAGV